MCIRRSNAAVVKHWVGSWLTKLASVNGTLKSFDGRSPLRARQPLSDLLRQSDIRHTCADQHPTVSDVRMLPAPVKAYLFGLATDSRWCMAGIPVHTVLSCRAASCGQQKPLYVCHARHRLTRDRRATASHTVHHMTSSLGFRNMLCASTTCPPAQSRCSMWMSPARGTPCAIGYTQGGSLHLSVKLAVSVNCLAWCACATSALAPRSADAAASPSAGKTVTSISSGAPSNAAKQSAWSVREVKSAAASPSPPQEAGGAPVAFRSNLCAFGSASVCTCQRHGIVVQAVVDEHHTVRIATILRRHFDAAKLASLESHWEGVCVHQANDDAGWHKRCDAG